MFTVKFFRSILSDEWEKPAFQQQSIACVNYAAYERPNGVITITTFSKMTDTDPVDRHIGPDDWSTCYIENIAGKTIAAYHADKDVAANNSKR
jgi:hypothetical protein